MKKILHFLDKIYCAYGDLIKKYYYHLDWRVDTFDSFVGCYIRGEVTFFEGLMLLIKGDI